MVASGCVGIIVWQKILNISAKTHQNISILDRVSFYNNALMITDLQVKEMLQASQ